MRNFFKTANFELLCQSIQLDNNPDTIKDTLHKASNIIANNRIDWDELYLRAEINCIKPQLWRLLHKISSPAIPEKIILKLATENRENLYKQLQNVSEYFQIKKLLDEAGIPAIPFKGFWLAHAFYGNLADRESVDVDLFIHPCDVGKIKAIMLQRGYVPEEPLSQLKDDYILNELCEYNFDMYEGKTRIYHFEFHWRVSLNVYGMNINLNELQSHVKIGTLQHKELNIFTPSANLLLAIMHHAGKDQLLQLKQVMDIAFIIKKHPDIDWEWVIKKVEKYTMENLLYVSVKMASILTGIKIPAIINEKANSTFILRLVNNRISMIEEKKDRDESFKRIINNWYFQLRSRSSTKLKIRLILHECRKSILPQLIPKKIRHLFLNKKIRTSPVN